MVEASSTVRINGARLYYEARGWGVADWRRTRSRVGRGDTLGVETRDGRRRLREIMVFGSGNAKEFEYIRLDPPVCWDMSWCLERGIIPDHWGGKTFIALCRKCEERHAEDPAVDALGHPMPNHLFTSEEDKRPVCWDCREAAFGEAFEHDIIAVLEEKLGLAEKHREALRSFIETIFTDPKKIVQLADLDNRVKGLERQNTIMWAVIGGLVIALLAVVVALVVALVVGA